MAYQKQKSRIDKNIKRKVFKRIYIIMVSRRYTLWNHNYFVNSGKEKSGVNIHLVGARVNLFSSVVSSSVSFLHLVKWCSWHFIHFLETQHVSLKPRADVIKAGLFFRDKPFANISGGGVSIVPIEKKKQRRTGCHVTQRGWASILGFTSGTETIRYVSFDE